MVRFSLRIPSELNNKIDERVEQIPMLTGLHVSKNQTILALIMKGLSEPQEACHKLEKREARRRR